MVKVSAKVIKLRTLRSLCKKLQQTFSSHINPTQPNKTPSPPNNIKIEILINQPNKLINQLNPTFLSMDFQLKQWRNQQDESEEQQPYSSAKIPKLEPHLTQPEQAASSGYALPLFAPEPDSKITMSAFSESTTLVSSSPSATRFSRMGSYFSMSQWQELELQALIFRYMLAGAAVPPELLQPIKKSLLHSPAYFFHHPLQHYPALLQSGYWGGAAMDPEPTRCRRTDGKKWRCSKDVVGGQKYCERHVHRGRNRSRKPVEVTTNTTTTNGGGGGGGILNAATITNSTAVTVASSMGNGSGGGTHFALSGSSPSIDLLHLHQSNSESNTDNRSFFETRRDVSGGATSDSHVLRPFFVDWPGQLNDADNARNNASSMNSATSLSISLKLSTGNVVDPGHHANVVDPGHHTEREQPQLNWPMGWGSTQMASMGGPLAEALRSSNSNSSPTSVLHQLPRSSASQTSFIST